VYRDTDRLDRTLNHYGYPSDMQKLATDLALRQAEMLAGEFSGE
jgi:hypothetical protein